MVYAGVIFDGADGVEDLPSDLNFRIRMNGTTHLLSFPLFDLNMLSEALYILFAEKIDIPVILGLFKFERLTVNLFIKF